MKKLFIRDSFWILVIILIASSIRLFNIHNVPPSLTMDEVAIGYNAYSILTTGKDEWGTSFPLAFKSVGDYKPPINIYLTVPFIWALGLTEVAVRLPSAILGILTPILIFFLLQHFSLRREEVIAGALWFALLPWHILFSRSSYEAVSALFFVLLGCLLFLKAQKKKSFFIFSLSLCSFALSIWAYHAERVFTPLLMLFLLLNYRKQFAFLKKDIRKFSISILPFVILIVPFLALTMFTPAIKTRALSTSVIREQDLANGLHFGEYSSTVEFVFNNDIYMVTRHVVGKYMNYFDPRFWFWKSGSYSPPGFLGFGLMYPMDILIIPLGLFVLFSKKRTVLSGLSLFWFLAGPLAASLTMNEQHPLRALVWSPFFAIAFALGVNYLLDKFPKYSRYMVAAYSVLFLLAFGYYLDMYFVQSGRFFSEYGQYGYKDIASLSCAQRRTYKEVVITDTFGSAGPVNTGTPYLYILFYCSISPSEFQEARTIEGFSFRRPDWVNDKKRDNTLLVGAPWEFDFSIIPPDKIVEKIYYLNGQLAFVAVESLGEE